MIIGAACGLILWLACYLQFKHVPAAIPFYVAGIAFIFGSGACLLIPFEDDIPAAERTALACAVGTGVAPCLIYVLAICHGGFVFPPAAFAATGAIAGRWFFKPTREAPPRGDGLWYLALPLLVFVVTAWVSFAHIRVTDDAITLFGNYDTIDLTYYAAIGSELNHTDMIPPASPFYAGHRVIDAYFPLILLAAIHKLTGVRLVHAFVGLGWPLFMSVATGAVFAFCRRLGSVPFAVLTTVLVFFGSGLAWVAAWLWPAMVNFDPQMWSVLFTAPSAEWLYFNKWGPALILVFAGFYASTRVDEPKGFWWALMAGLSFGLLFLFKSFAFEIIVPAFVIAAVVSKWRRDPFAGRMIVVAVSAVICAAPWLLSILPFNRVENRGAVTSIRWFASVDNLIFKMDINGVLEELLPRFFGGGAHPWVILSIASVVFLIGGLGTRCLGIVPLWKAAIGRTSMRVWTALAWIVLLGVSMSFAIKVIPFPNSIQTYQFGLFALWPFAVYVIWPPHARPSVLRWIASAALVCCSVPATVHYLRSAHASGAERPLVHLGTGDLQIIRYLLTTDVEGTRILHSRPRAPSLYVVEAERRAVLAWSTYASDDVNPKVFALEAEVEQFFGSATSIGADDVSFLRRYDVTHVIERTATDRLHPGVLQQLHLIMGTADVRLYEVPAALRR